MSTMGPKLVYGRTIELDELAEWTANRSGLTAEEVERVLKAVRSAVIHYCRAGRPIHRGRPPPLLPWIAQSPPRTWGNSAKDLDQVLATTGGKSLADLGQISAEMDGIESRSGGTAGREDAF